MSLRVLLADESASIRKVFQMGLQDFGAEVKSVHNGLDVLEVAQNFQPHIIFADILLQKKNGYEVSQEIQGHTHLSDVPVVLMWSSFMELDQKQFQACKAQGELEKPFDVESMRQLIAELVKKKESPKISSFLTFPDTITESFVEEENEKKQQFELSDTPAPPLQKSQQPQTPAAEVNFSSQDLQLDEPSEAILNNDEIDTQDIEVEELETHSVFNSLTEEESPLPIPPPPQSAKPPIVDEDLADAESWAPKPLQQTQKTQRLHTETETEDNLDQFQSMDLNQEKKLNLEDFLYQPETTPVQTEDSSSGLSSKIQNVQVSDYELTNSPIAPPMQMSPEEQEAIIRSEVRSQLKSGVLDQLPSLLERIVREELEKIMQQELALKNNPPEKS